MIRVKVQGQKLIASYDTTVADSEQYLNISFEFSEEWENTTKTAIYKNGTAYEQLISDINIVPYEVIKTPGFTLSIVGVDNDKVITTDEVTIPVIKSGYVKGETPTEPTPTVYQQIINECNDTKEIAQSVRTDADNGVFNGPKGDGFFIKNEVKGNLIGVVDSADYPIQDFNINGEHESFFVRVTGKNIIPKTYADGWLKMSNGLIFSVDTDGVITVNGTATATTNFYISNQKDTTMFLTPGYYFNQQPQGWSSSTYWVLFSGGSVNRFYVSTIGARGDMILQIKTGVTCDNLKVYPMIEHCTSNALTGSAYVPSKGTQQITISTPLSAEAKEQLKSLKTYYGETYITNSVNENMSVLYVADDKLYIDNKFNELQALTLDV